MTQILAGIFNIVNESLICIGTGVFGLISVLINGNPMLYLEYVGLTALGAGFFIKFYSEKQKRPVNFKNVIFITGCDSGLGYNLAMHCYELNMYVIAGCFNLSSDGAKKLESHCDKKRFLLIQLDIRRTESVQMAYKTVSKLLETNPTLIFTALVNNAGVMTFGEFEWQTDALIENQINVNLLGTMTFTKCFLPLIRKHTARIITVTSHCALEALPGLAPYAASKVGLRFWNDSLRVELHKYGIYVINFIPGSFISASNIMANQEIHANEMSQSLTEEQVHFYGDYFTRYHNYLKVLSGYKKPQRMDNVNLMRQFENALLDDEPNSVYKHEPWRYKLYHWLFSMSPVFVRDWLIQKFMNMPEFTQKTSNRFINS